MINPSYFNGEHFWNLPKDVRCRVGDFMEEHKTSINCYIVSKDCVLVLGCGGDDYHNANTIDILQRKNMGNKKWVELMKTLATYPENYVFYVKYNKNCKDVLSYFELEEVL